MIASTGQTCAQGATGDSQCMQTVGCVATLSPRAMKSTIIMLSPLWESHSRQAASQARHPMQRDGSTNNVSMDIVRSLSLVLLALLFSRPFCLADRIRNHTGRIVRRQVFGCV